MSLYIAVEQKRLYTAPFVMMALANLFSVSSIGVFFLLPLFIVDRGGSRADIGIFMGLMALSSVVFRPWISGLVDQIGRKKTYAFGCLILTAASMSYLFFDGRLRDFYWPLALVRLFHGVGVAFCFTAAFTYVADVIPEARLNEGIGMFGTTGLAGMALGPLVAELVIRHLGFTAFFLTGALMSLTAFLLQWPLPESFIRSEEYHRESFFRVLVRPGIGLVAALAVLFGIALASTGSFVAPFAQHLHLEFVSLFFIAYSSAAILTRLFGGRLADRVGERTITPYALLLTGIGVLSISLLNGNMVLLISGLVTGTGHGFLFPCLNTLAIRNQPPEIRGKINGIYTGGIDGGIFLGAVALGYVGEWFGYPFIFLVSGSALLFGLVLSHQMIRKM